MMHTRQALESVIARSFGHLPDIDLVAMAWPLAAGPRIAQHSSVRNISNGCVHVEVDSPSWANEIGPMKAALLENLKKVSQLDLSSISIEG